MVGIGKGDSILQNLGVTNRSSSKVLQNNVMQKNVLQNQFSVQKQATTMVKASNGLEKIVSSGNGIGSHKIDVLA